MTRSARAALTLVVGASLIAPATAAASPGWATPVATLTSATTSSAFQPHVVSDAQGDTAVVWSDASGNIFESDRPAGGSFSPATQISQASGQELGSVAIDSTGLIYVFFVTNEQTATASQPNVATKPIGGATWTVTPLAGASSSDPPTAPIVGAVNASGQGVAVWYQGHTAGNEQSTLQYATKAAGSSTWTGKATVANTGNQGNFTSPSLPVLAIDPSGDAALVYLRYDTNFIRQIVWGTTLTHGASGWTNANAIMADVNPDNLVGEPVVSIGPDGTATAAWVRNDNASNNIVQVTSKSLSATSWPAAPSGTSTSPGADDVSATGHSAGQPAIATEPDGTATIAWAQDGTTLMERTRPAASTTWGAAATIPTTLTGPGAPVLVPAPDGSMVALWSGENGTGSSVIASVQRAAGGSTFTDLPDVPGSGNSEPAGAADDQGNVAVAWVNSPTAGQFQEQATRLTVAALPGSPGGGAGTGAGAATGTGAGTGTGIGTGAGPGTGSAGTALTLTGLSESAKTWREGAKLATFARKRTPVGTTFSFTLNQPATVRLSFMQPGTGRSVAGKCVAQTRRNRGHARCSLVEGTLAHAGHAGLNTVAFDGRLSPRRKLAPGSYTLIISAADTAGQTSAPQTLTFTIAKG